jgi:hypothetical protein
MARRLFEVGYILISQRIQPLIMLVCQLATHPSRGTVNIVWKRFSFGFQYVAPDFVAAGNLYHAAKLYLYLSKLSQGYITHALSLMHFIGARHKAYQTGESLRISTLISGAWHPVSSPF